MKKILLFSLSLGIALSGFSQKLVKEKADKKNHTVIHSDFNLQQQASAYQSNPVEFKSDKSVLIETSVIGYSANAYTLLTSEQRCMAYDEATGAILGTFRADPATYTDALASGSVVAHYSTDGGDNWDHVVTVNPENAVHSLRYPSGVIYNPDGSSDVNDLYQVSAGPSHTGGVWDNTFFGTAKLDGTATNDYYYEWPLADGNTWARSSMTVVPDAVMMHGQDYEDAGTSQGKNQTIQVYAGTGDASDGLDWDIIGTVTPDWFMEDGVALAMYTSYSAWSRDGTIGYAWMIGVTNDSEEYGGYQPQVFYTEDGGEDWEEIELDMEDHPALVEYLAPWEDVNGNPGTVKPTMAIAEGGSRNFPGVVDNSGRLHLFAPMFGMGTESSAGESTYWTRANAPGGDIFDIILDTDGLQNIVYVDSVRTKKMEIQTWGGVGTDAVNWDHRLQASKSLDETMVFAIWNDDDAPAEDDEYNSHPDIKGWSYNAEYDVAGESINFTSEDLYAGYFFYHFVSELTPFVDGKYQVPVSTSLTFEEYTANDAAAVCTHNYLKGIEFPEIVTGIENIAAKSSFEVTQNSPNPFSTFTTVNINSTTVADVMVEVSNLMGQSVYAINAGIINGSMKVNIPAADLQTGVYFYTVTIGNESVTKKMIVE